MVRPQPHHYQTNLRAVHESEMLLGLQNHEASEARKNHRMGPPSYVCWFIDPINNGILQLYIVISTINHRIQQ